MNLPRFVLGLALVAAFGHAAPADQAIVAAMKVVDAPNYTWICSAPSTGRALVVREGKTEKNGFSIVTFVDPQTPMLRQISRLNDGVVLAIFRGPEDFVFQTSSGWKTGQELPPLGPRRRGTTGGADYWIAIQIPHEELEIIIGSFTEIHAVDGGFAGTLSEAGARQLLGATRAPAVSARGTFNFVVKNGTLLGYLVDLSGTVLVGEPGQEKESPPQRRLLITEIKDLGRTKVDVPVDARIKFGG